jgi:hypothetical protein
MDSMRRAFKVATVFTGAAAAAAAFTPAAMAATATGAQRMEPATSSPRNCNQNLLSTTSMVFTWLPSAHHGQTCIGDGDTRRRGIGTSPSANYGNYCAGNNSGYLYYSGLRKKTFTPGHPGRATSGLGGAFVSFVSITGFHGSDKCAIS